MWQLSIWAMLLASGFGMLPRPPAPHVYILPGHHGTLFLEPISPNAHPTARIPEQSLLT